MTPKLPDDYEQEMFRVKSERDELLSVLKDVVDDLKARWDMRDARTNPGIKDNVERADAVIAKVEGRRTTGGG